MSRILDEKVDMNAIARENTLADTMLSRPGMIKLIAPAKVNLVLEVGARDKSGYHEVRTVLHALSLHDTLYMRCVPAGIDAQGVAPAEPADCGGDLGEGLDIALVVVGKEGVEAPACAPRDNIVFRAVAALAKALGREECETVEIVLEKRIPHAAGLGGGSSDGAAALLGAAKLWGMDPADASTREMLVEVAAGLGSDVPFFLEGGCAFYDGRGERFVKKLAVRGESLVLVKPEIGLSTGAVYAAFDELGATGKTASAGIHGNAASSLAAIDSASSAEDLSLANNLAPAAESLAPVLREVREWLGSQEGVALAGAGTAAGDAVVAGSNDAGNDGANDAGGEPLVLLCGSGASTFAVCEDFAVASRIAAAAQARGYWARATSFAKLGAALLG